MRVSRRSKRASSSALVGIGFLLAFTPAFGWDQWRDVADLERALDARDSATETLRLWCIDHQQGGDTGIHAVREALSEPPSADVLRWLGTKGVDTIRYRRVRLVCGGATLSVADNWYRADVLTPAMDEILDHSDKPFGQVVAPMGLHRRALSSERLPARSGFVLRRRAVLLNDRGQAFSVVEERYTAAILKSGPIH